MSLFRKPDQADSILNGHVVGETLIDAEYLSERFIQTLDDEAIADQAQHIANSFEYVSEENRPWFQFGIEEAIKDHRK